MFLFLVISTLDSSCLAYNDGSRGTTSSGGSTVTLNVSNVVMVTKVNDIDLTGAGAYTGTGNIGASGNDAYDDVCIYSNDSDLTYDVTAVGDNGLLSGDSCSGGSSTDFKLRSTAGDCVVYRVYWNTTTGGGLGAEISSPGSVLSGQTGASNSLTCDGGVNASFNVYIAQATAQALKPGTYRGKLTLQIMPD